MKTEPSMNTVDFFTFCELHQLWQAVIQDGFLGIQNAAMTLTS